MVGYKIRKYFSEQTHAAPLAVFRIVFGLMITAGIVRFWASGWIYDLYIKPKFYFPFYGLEFIQPLGNFTYPLFFLAGLCGLLVAAGLFYRTSIIILFCSFTYIELIDRSTYLNHYYFVSLILFLLIFLPAGRFFSVDSYRNKKMLADQIPRWSVDSVKLMVLILYFYAGLAKLNSDWLIHALPLRIWLPARNDMPVLGTFFGYPGTAFLFSWIGCLYDLSIGFLLWKKQTRLFAYFSVVVFHILTAILFPIGMFPYIMIVTALIFFSAQFHLKIIDFLNRAFKLNRSFIEPSVALHLKNSTKRLTLSLFALFFTFQLLFPFRYLLYPGELFWTEQGYRFSWRVMLMEKAGYAQLTVKDGSGKQIVVNNAEFLTPLQEKMMSTQPDMILQYAQLLRDHYASAGFHSPEVYADAYVALNGRSGQVLINPKTDLAKEAESFKPKPWIIPLDDVIKGF